MKDMKELGTVGLIGRFKPIHKETALLLQTVCEKSDKVVIGIGSSNKYNLRNPFTAEETKDLIDLVLFPKYSNYTVFSIPDSAHIPEYKNGQKWRKFVVEHFGKLDHLITGNEYVEELLKNDYHVIHPSSIVSSKGKVMLKASKVRFEIANFGDWKSLVPEKVVQYLEKNRIIERFRNEFGKETLEKFSEEKKWLPESIEQEKEHTFEK